MENKTKASTIVLSILLGVSVLFNLLLFFSFYYIGAEWDNNYNNLNIEWCEIENDNIVIINSLIEELQSYNSYYDDISLFETTDCWG